jgi:hypothetical protein
MARKTPRYFTDRPGAEGKRRFFWQPSKELGRLGWKLTRLSDRYAEAVAQADWVNAVLDAWRTPDADLAAGILRSWAMGGAGNNHGLVPSPAVAVIVPGLTIESGVATLPAAVGVKSVAALIDAFRQSEEWQDISEVTRKGYAEHMAAIRVWAGDIPVRNVRKKRIRDYHKALRRSKSLGSANARLRVLSVLFSYAVNEEWIELDPTKRLKLKGTPPRVLIIRQDEEAAMIRAADAEGRFDIADLIVAAADIGQRQADLFDMNEGQWGGDRWRIRQGKRGAIVYPKPSPRLALRIEAAKARRLEAWPAHRFLKAEDRLTFINERTGARWNISTFSHEFARLRALAAKECPSILTRQLDNRETGKLTRIMFLDWRDTHVTRAAISGATIAQIRSTTGHTIGSIQTVLQHYLGTEPELAAAGANNLAAMLAQIEAEQKAA